MRRLSLVASFAVALFFAQPADAQYALRASYPTMDNQLSFWLIPVSYDFPEGLGVGLGARYQKILAPQGFIRWTNGMKDEFGLEFGIDYLHGNFSVPSYGPRWAYNEVDLVLGATWNFWITRNLAIYPKIDLGLGISSFAANPGYSTPSDYGGLYLDFQPGIAYYIADRVLVRAEVGTRDLRLGVGFNY